MLREIHTSAQLMEYIQQIGFLPLLYSGIAGFSAEEVVDDAAEAKWFSVNALPPLAFDHNEIMADAIAKFNALKRE